MKKLTILFFVLFIFLQADVRGQAMGNNYRTALGVKFYPGAISFKHFIQPNRAVEALGYFYNYGFRFTGLYEIHGNINDLPGLKWYIGPGAHIGTYNNAWHRRYGYHDTRMAIGVDGVIGLDLKINKAPINISLDWQPSLNLVGYTYFESGWGGLGIRYTLK
jgi:hypothetical protein